jgi:hypothetical protein
MHHAAARRGCGAGAHAGAARAANARRRAGARSTLALASPLLLLLLASALPRGARGDAPPPPCFQCRPTGWDNGQSDPANTQNLTCCRAAVPPTPPTPPPEPPAPPPAAPPAPAPPAAATPTPSSASSGGGGGVLNNAAAVPALVGCLVGASLLGLCGGVAAWRAHRRRRGPSVPFMPSSSATSSLERLRRISARISGSVRNAFAGGGSESSSSGPRIGPDGLPMRIGSGMPPRSSYTRMGAPAERDCETGGGGGGGFSGGKRGGAAKELQMGSRGLPRSASAPQQVLHGVSPADDEDDDENDGG